MIYAFVVAVLLLIANPRAAEGEMQEKEAHRRLCQVPCGESSTSCCIRGMCGCVETLGTAAGCEGACGGVVLGAPPCTSSSLACCFVGDECIDLGAYLEAGYDDTDCTGTCHVFPPPKVDDGPDIVYYTQYKRDTDHQFTAIKSSSTP